MELKFENVASSEYAILASQLAEAMKKIVPFEGEGDDTPMPPGILEKRLTVLLFTAISASKFYGQPLEFVQHNVETIYNGIRTPAEMAKEEGSRH